MTWKITGPSGETIVDITLNSCAIKLLSRIFVYIHRFIVLNFGQGSLFFLVGNS